jgi:hypothetical protein
MTFGLPICYQWGKVSHVAQSVLYLSLFTAYYRVSFLELSLSLELTINDHFITN